MESYNHTVDENLKEKCGHTRSALFPIRGLEFLKKKLYLHIDLVVIRINIQ